jgi:hypothetical protein
VARNVGQALFRHRPEPLAHQRQEPVPHPRAIVPLVQVRGVTVDCPSERRVDFPLIQPGLQLPAAKREQRSYEAARAARRDPREPCHPRPAVSVWSSAWCAVTK